MSQTSYFAACINGLEPALEEELRALGADDISVRTGGVAFSGDKALGYRACLWLRSAVRVQEELAHTQVRDADELHDAVRALPWERWIAPDQTLAVYASTQDTKSLRHSGFVALRIKDGVVDRIREKHGQRPSVDTRQPDVPLKAVIHSERFLLYRDLAGASLHKRGCRPAQVRSPLNESTAAGLLDLAGWDGQGGLVDPMCGSGTFLIEAAWKAMDRAPGLTRSFAFEKWIDHDRGIWGELLDEARGRLNTKPDVVLEGADHHGGALALAKTGLQLAGVDHLIRLRKSDARDFQPTVTPTMVVTNPPYGVRIGDGEELVDSWQSLGNFLHRYCGGATAWVLCGDPTLTRFLGLKTSRRIPVMNGPIECRWLRYEIRAPRKARAD
jgi:putative N6-adenine-specific DNA methylase